MARTGGIGLGLTLAPRALWSLPLCNDISGGRAVTSPKGSTTRCWWGQRPAGTPVLAKGLMRRQTHCLTRLYSRSPEPGRSQDPRREMDDRPHPAKGLALSIIKSYQSRKDTKKQSNVRLEVWPL